MAGTSQKTDHQSRLDWWRGQFQRQRKANLSVAEFCRQLGVGWKGRAFQDRLPAKDTCLASSSRNDRRTHRVT